MRLSQFSSCAIRRRTAQTRAFTQDGARIVIADFYLDEAGQTVRTERVLVRAD